LSVDFISGPVFCSSVRVNLHTASAQTVTGVCLQVSEQSGSNPRRMELKVICCPECEHPENELNVEGSPLPEGQPKGRAGPLGSCSPAGAQAMPYVTQFSQRLLVMFTEIPPRGDYSRPLVLLGASDEGLWGSAAGRPAQSSVRGWGSLSSCDCVRLQRF